MSENTCPNCGKPTIEGGVCSQCGYEESETKPVKKVTTMPLSSRRSKFVSERQKRFFFWKLHQTGEYNPSYHNHAIRTAVICPQCGTKNDNNASVCSNCNAKLSVAG